MAHHIDDMVLIRPDDQEGMGVLEALVRHTCFREWKINPPVIQSTEVWEDI